MITIVTWLWKGNRAYQPSHVNVLASMFRRHLSIDHRFVCISDVSEGFDSPIEVMPIPTSAEQLGQLRTPEGKHFPSCYRRLWMFSREAECLGGRVLLIDIDAVVTGNIDHLFDAKDSFVGWRPEARWGTGNRLAGGMYLLTPGSRSDVFERFKGARSITEARIRGYRGSDQAWISYQLGRNAVVWPKQSGIYSVRDFQGDLPSDACVVHFNGKAKPWDSKSGWVLEHWR